MIKQLKIRNLILIEEAEILFEKGLNVLTGETGSGKSAILHALAMIQGDKIDSGILRKGSEKGSVEALFSIGTLPHIIHLLDESGIDPLDDHGDPELLIKREIQANGRTRAFINNQIVQASLLEKISEGLFEIVGQHANQTLRTADQHRQLLDIYGELTSLHHEYKESWQEKNRLTQELQTLTSKESERIRAIEICEIEIEEIQEARLNEEADEMLFQEYTLLCNAEERASVLDELLNTLQGERGAILPNLRKCEQISGKLCEMDQELGEVQNTLKSTFIELEEIAYTLRNYRLQIDINPQRISQIDQRLSLLNKLKRKYGSTISEIEAYKISQEKKRDELKNADERIELIKQHLKQEELALRKLADKLTKSRKSAADALGKSLTEQLQVLNMPKAEFKVELTPQEIGPQGQEKVEFYMAPNAGEKCMPIRECASGGELSRVLLALKVLLAGKALIPTIIFDEIDSNIGGATAVVIGQKFREIGEAHQVFCITHFAQVAKLGDHHLQIRKEEQDGRTFTRVEALNVKGRQKEIDRMLGIVKA